jgi:hypothetical protein
MTLELTPAQYLAVWNSLAQYVENEEADGDPDARHADYEPARELLDQLDASIAQLAEPTAA